MAKIRKEFKSLTASRTGLPAVQEDDQDSLESNRGGWLIIIAIVIAFTVALQMESEQRTPDKKTLLNYMATQFDPAS